MALVSSSSWNLTAAAPLPARVQRALAYLDVPTPASAPPLAETPPTPPTAPAAPASPSFIKQLALGLAIFAGVLAAAIPFAFFSEGMALAAAVGVGSVLVAIFARRLRIALMIATLLAVLGAFAATHSIHVALQPSTFPIRLAALAPAAGETPRAERPLQLATAVVTPVRAEIGGARIPFAGWAFPVALFAFWTLGFAAIVANRKLARWAWRHLAKRMQAAG